LPGKNQTCYTAPAFEKNTRQRLGLAGLGFFQAQSFVVTEHEIRVKGLSKPVSVMHILDLHLGAQRAEAYLQKVLDAVNSRRSDLVACTTLVSQGAGTFGPRMRIGTLLPAE
jgi:predicted MPP superfamily phosphohydrolase